MRFLVDAQLPLALARWIASNGHDAQHVFDIGLSGASDRAIWDQAVSSNSIIVTKDDDFIQMSRVRPGPAIVWVTTGNTSKRELLGRMERIFPQIVEALMAGERIVEIR
jgi:predicted nuclease of predicted toxin-antitoxin system